MLYIGIDLGTSAVKLLLMDETGNIRKIVSKEYPLFFPKPGWAEQNPCDWFAQSVEGMKELTEDCDRSQIAGIGFGGQMHGLVILDEKDEVIRPAILWNDGRTVEETDYLNHVIGKEKLSEYTGNIAFTGFTAPKLLWLKKHEPENFARISKIMLPKDFLAYRLSGVYSTDYSDASGMLLLDVAHKCWSEEMISICGIKAKMLPKLFESYDRIGTLLPEIAEDLGFPSSCIVAAGAGDNAAAAVGTGTVGTEADGTAKCNISLGTSGTVFLTNARFGVDRNHALHSFAHADGSYHLMGCMLCAASCNKWFMEEILQSQNFDKAQAGITELGKNHVYFLPYLMGERSPHNDAQAKGAFIGMTLDTDRKDMIQAVLEGVAFALKDSLRAAESIGCKVKEATICGGGAKSPLWKQILSNVLNIRLSTVDVEEGPAYGGAILAAVADGVYPSVEEAVKKIVRRTKTILPDSELVEQYAARYQTFQKLYPALKSCFKEMDA